VYVFCGGGERNEGKKRKIGIKGYLSLNLK